ncbi:MULTISPECIES: helix-turn-helix domain-containing protein [Streptomyces]|uniref:DNA-binding protein n=1 Tax=Streptomyces dengpaensis TaxID=2049881 RepID=A0ABN5IBL1_9ACTN|nr:MULTISPECIES: helix-turn-helix domain-containing protein [Streptomyces]AVH59722.1 DNA-binding protein [Streptomyces dengpaensis]PIB09366.1 hypothetical protein B1C81_09340 [Streptomyces sp. HG99]
MPPQATPAAPSRPALNLMSVDEAAALLDRSPRTVRQLAAAGTLPAHRVGARVWVFDRTALDHYRHGRTAA